MLRWYIQMQGWKCRNIFGAHLICKIIRLVEREDIGNHAKVENSNFKIYTCQNEIGLCAQNMSTKLGLTIDSIGRAYVIIAQRE
jgi:hypothetical protein